MHLPWDTQLIRRCSDQRLAQLCLTPPMHWSGLWSSAVFFEWSTPWRPDLLKRLTSRCCPVVLHFVDYITVVFSIDFRHFFFFFCHFFVFLSLFWKFFFFVTLPPKCSIFAVVLIAFCFSYFNMFSSFLFMCLLILPIRCFFVFVFFNLF